MLSGLGRGISRHDYGDEAEMKVAEVWVKVKDAYSGLEKQAGLLSEGGSCFNIARIQRTGRRSKPESDFRCHVPSPSA